VCRQLAAGEIPAPPERVKVLFVGVAPTPEEGMTTGGHFFASATDNLRVGLFKLLDQPPYNFSISRLPLADGNRRFFEAGLFFVRAAKVRPIADLSPPRPCTRYCARRHLRAEIEYIGPRAICFLGETNAAPAAKELFGREVGSEPREARLGGWTGLVAVSPQPVRNNTNRIRAKQIVDRLPML
jgi:uracil-DNA glycosylase